MTVITKNLGEKKSDNLKEPLVENIVVEPIDEGKKIDVEAGGYPVPPPQTTRYIISARVRPYYSLMFILMLVLLVATSLLGIFGTEYLYEQYRSLVGPEKQEVYRAWGTLSLDDDPRTLSYDNEVSAHFRKIEPAESNGILSENEDDDLMIKLGENPDSLFNNKNDEEDVLFQHGSENTDFEESSESKDEDKDESQKTELKEQFELDLSKDRYEKINIPDRGASRFVHDFYSNFTAIVDVDNKRCFIMPLDRTAVLPPKSLYDLLFKMTDGYYSLNTEKIRHDMRAVRPAIEDISVYGTYIQRECGEFVSYKLEKFVGGVVKRSVQESESFLHFAGTNILEINIVQGLEAPVAVP